MSLLETEGVSVHFGGNAALDDVTIDIPPGQVTGLIGPNGAGKTTLFNVIVGMQSPTTGRVVLDGRDVTRKPPNVLAGLGMARTFQRLELFVSLSVRDNLRVAGDVMRARRDRSFDVDRETDRILETIGLSDIADLEVTAVPTGQARMVEVGRALMTRPSVLLLDEPVAGQSETETAQFAELLQRLCDDGLAICLVEHDLELVMKACSTIHVLDRGRLVTSGSPAEVRASPEVTEAYLGSYGTTEGGA